jgi:hypothetical protein
MPTIPSMDLPKPKNWQEFEMIVRDSLVLRCRSSGFQKHGKSGQKQSGVDIIGPDEIGRLVGIQCKRYDKPLTMKQVVTEVGKADNFKGKLSALFIATTAEHDSTLQGQVRELSDKRVASGDFAVAILYWDEIVSGLILNPHVFNAHFPQFKLPTFNEADKERLIAALELGYYGADIWQMIVVLLGEFGQMAHVDPDEVRIKLQIIEHRAQQILTPVDTAVVLESLAEIRRLLPKPKKSHSAWDPVEDHAKRISARIQSGSSLLPLAESNVLDLGMQLGRIYHYADSIPAPSVRKDIEVKVRNIIRVPTTKSSIRKRFAKANSYTAGYGWANLVFALLDHEIRFGGV